MRGGFRLSKRIEAGDTAGVTDSIPHARSVVGTRLIFFLAGFAISAWAPLVPIVKSQLALSESLLGLLLLCVGLGSVLTMPIAGGLAARFGCRSVTQVAACVLLVGLIFVVIAPTAPILGGALLLVGAGMGTVDVVMNIQAVMVERAAERPMMSGFHALFSIGGIAGAGLMSTLLGLRFTPLLAMACVVSAGFVILVGAHRGLLSTGLKSEGPPMALPRGPVLTLGIMCLVLFLAEGSVLDWSGVHLRENFSAPESQAGWGYIAFSATMSLGRLTGDRIVAQIGRKVALLGGLLLAAVGFAVVALSPTPELVWLGYAIVGAGAANVVPILFTLAGNQSTMPAHLAVSAVTTMGYAGFLAGPAIIGFVAQGTSLLASCGLLGLGISACLPLAQRAVSEHQSSTTTS